MKAPLAAAYLGLGQTKFLAGVKAGRYPAPVADGGNKLWRLADLAKWVETNGAPCAPSPPESEFVRGWRNVDKGHAR
jgi:hypothetical protein